MKDWLFKQYWRINQARNVISLFFWIAMFVGIWVPLIQIVIPLNKWILSIIVGLLSIIFALFLGYIWDTLELWKADTQQAIKRTIAYTEPLEKERRYLYPLLIETAKAVAKLTKDKRLKKKIEEVEEWIAKQKY